MLSEELLEDLAAVHLHPQTQAGGDLDLTPLLRAVEAAAVAAERERCAAICDEARDAIWPYHEPEVLNAACTVCENLAKRIRGVEA